MKLASGFLRLTFGLFIVLLILFSRDGEAQTTSQALTWDYTQGTNPAIGFNMYRAATCTGPFVKLNATALLPLALLTYTDSTVAVGQTYCWKVTAQDALGVEASGPTSQLSFRIPGVLAAPLNLRITP
jgi:hypothetical protein